MLSKFTKSIYWVKQNQFRENAVTLLNQSCPFLQIRPLPALTELRTLHMRNTQRNLTNIPVNLEGLIHLEDVDMSQNELTKIPEGLLSIPNLKRLNLGSNQITEISTDIERWQQMETFILSRNKIKVLPPGKNFKDKFLKHFFVLYFLRLSCLKFSI